MAIFDDITISWKNKDYTIPYNRVLKAIASIESVVTLHELAQYADKGYTPLAKLAQAYGAVLRYVGCMVTDDEVYDGMFSDGGPEAVGTAVQTILAMMLPPSLKTNTSPDKSTGNPQGAGVPSSKRRIKR